MDLFQTTARTADVMNRILIVGRVPLGEQGDPLSDYYFCFCFNPGKKFSQSSSSLTSSVSKSSNIS